MRTDPLILHRHYQPKKHTRRYVEYYITRTQKAIQWRQGTWVNRLIARVLLLENCIMN